jgi:hypothetical protein
MDDTNAPRARRVWTGLAWPGAWLGAGLVAVCWPLNWTLPGARRTAYLFFPLWLGYILIVDACVQRRTGSSLCLRLGRRFALLFLWSAPVWWLFELINWRTGNWEYIGEALFTRFQYYALCTLCFSVVMPAVFETAELVRSFGWVERLGAGPRLPPTPRLCGGLLLAGLAMLGLMLAWPRWFYPCMWLSLVLVLDPINRWLGRPHLLQELEFGDWRKVVSLSLGALVCGAFWEMWNYYSSPKWVYHTPGVQFLHLFEMPLLGYGGYIPFGLELYALLNLLRPNAPRLRL